MIRPGEGGDLLFLPPRNPNVERWTGPKWGPGEDTAAELGFDEVLSTQPSEIVLDARRRPVPGFEGRLHGWLSEPGAVLWTELPAVSSGAVLPPTHRFLSAMRDRVPTFSVRDIGEHMTALRSIKDSGEIDLMRKAIDISIEGQLRAARTIRPGIGEGVVDGAVYAAFREGGAEGLAFPSIVGSGYNARSTIWCSRATTARPRRPGPESPSSICARSSTEYLKTRAYATRTEIRSDSISFTASAIRSAWTPTTPARMRRRSSRAW
ncbi:MAG: M24 family metallopeptidase [Acidobacteria bacterium]|nr:M24 family metallopeptidase [Candidatus Sulfomarinibacter kjeldsenii]